MIDVYVHVCSSQRQAAWMAYGQQEQVLILKNPLGIF